MTRPTYLFRTLIGAAALAASAAVAEAQPPQDSTTSARRTTASAGTVDRSRRPARRTADRDAMGTEARIRAHSRDYYGADDPRCDDLCTREKMMDAKYGKNRERLPAARRP